ncbi:MAG: hypothetical protein ACLRHQ_02180 [Sellimonas intestinalis]|uniref:hypothetical protein n=1 Tax=Sellimonas intestinalis TaxID=1653434 RepID=UPI0039A0F0B9
MSRQKTLVPWFQRGDIGGMTYSITNNIVNYLIVISTLSGVLGWPDEIVYGAVIPGMSVGLMLSGIYYAFMGRRLSKKKAVRMSRRFLPEYPLRLCLLCCTG